jgi:predicted nucleic acid-binding protein
MTGSGDSSRIVLDSSAYSVFRTGDRDVLEAMAAATAVLVPTIVLGELEAGFRLGSHGKMNRQALEDFLEEPFVEVVPVTRDVSRTYGRIVQDLRRRGKPIPTNDIWIAACTISRAATLLTLDTDFRHVTGLSHLVLR